MHIRRGERRGAEPCPPCSRRTAEFGRVAGEISVRVGVAITRADVSDFSGDLSPTLNIPSLPHSSLLISEAERGSGELG